MRAGKTWAARLGTRPPLRAFGVFAACQASRGGSNHRAGVGMTTESLARGGRSAALRDRSGHFSNLSRALGTRPAFGVFSVGLLLAKRSSGGWNPALALA
jgi:hypothetical protein